MLVFICAALLVSSFLMKETKVVKKEIVYTTEQHTGDEKKVVKVIKRKRPVKICCHCDR